jgi:hypothetical protein
MIKTANVEVQGDLAEQGKALDLSEENHQERDRRREGAGEGVSKNKNKDNPTPICSGQLFVSACFHCRIAVVSGATWSEGHKMPMD